MQIFFNHLKLKENIFKGLKNPLNLNFENYIRFSKEPDIGLTDITLNEISDFEYEDKYLCIDYHLSGFCETLNQSIDLRLRIISDDGRMCSQLFRLFEKNVWDRNTHAKVSNRSGEFFISHDDVGCPLIHPRVYWCEENSNPNHKTVNSLTQSKKNKLLINEEVSMTYWEFFRQANDFFDRDIVEIIYVELNHKNKKCSILKGSEIEIEHASCFVD